MIDQRKAESPYFVLHNPEEWEFAFQQAGYDGDYGYITFE